VKLAPTQKSTAARALACGGSLMLLAALRPAPAPAAWARRRNRLIRSAPLPFQRTAIPRPTRSHFHAPVSSSAMATAATPMVPAAR